jgi:hypothetical protein
MKTKKIKKNLKKFLSSEEGKITKKRIVQMGVILGVASSMIGFNEAMAQHTNYLHNSAGTGKHGSHSSHSSHGSHGSHGSHVSHSSHSSHGSHFSAWPDAWANGGVGN